VSGTAHTARASDPTLPTPFPFAFAVLAKNESSAPLLEVQLELVAPARMAVLTVLS
jgi:hypothetical protein